MNLVKLKKDFVWYSIGAAIPMILGFVKTPIFTRHFSPADYGYLTLISTTYNYINLFAFSWIISCVWRYYIHEKNNRELNEFYTNIIVLFFIGLIITSIITLVWLTLSSNITIKKLIIANFINLITSSVTSIYLTIIRLDGKALVYNLYSVIISIVSLSISLVLIFIFKNSIDAMINSSNIVNIAVMIYIIYKFNKNYRIKKENISKELIIKLISYGFSSVFIQMSLLILVSGDRYVIEVFCSTDKVGIYSQVYNLAEISILAISNVIKNIMTPYEFKLFEEDITNEDEFYNYIILFIVCILPFTVYFSVYCRQISDLLLGEKFRSGYVIMPYIMISCLLYGLSDMHQDRLKFKNKLKYVCVSVIIAGALNIMLNIILVPKYGYECAAITTLVAYIVLYLLNVYFDFSAKDAFLNILKDKYELLSLMVIILFLQVSIHNVLANKFSFCTSVFYSIIEGSVFLTVYFIAISFSIKKLYHQEKNTEQSLFNIECDKGSY